jgi:adenosylcobinamide-GDP ribazoletransferase
MRSQIAAANAIHEEWRSLLTALQYFTRIPAPAWIGHEPGQLNRAARYFPAIGLLVGGVAALIIYSTAKILPLPLAVLLSVAATALVTGAFHEDGLADTFDGLGGGATRERALEIMKDSRLGTYGSLALILILALKVVALASLPAPLACAALLAAHPLSRWCALIVIDRRNYIGDPQQSRAKPVVDRTAYSHLMIGALFGVTPLFFAGYFAASTSLQLWSWIGIPLLIMIVTTIVLIRWFTRRLGGYTGDTLGATQQLTEVSCYLAWVALWNWY